MWLCLCLISYVRFKLVIKEDKQFAFNMYLQIMNSVHTYIVEPALFYLRKYHQSTPLNKYKHSPSLLSRIFLHCDMGLGDTYLELPKEK